MKLSKIYQFLLVTLLLIVCLYGITCKVEQWHSDVIDRISVTFYGDTNSQKAFTWFTTKKNDKRNVLQITKKSDRKANFKQAISYYADTGIATNQSSDVWHKVVATDLEANCTYCYRIGDPVTQKWSNTYELQTAATGDFSFLAITDTQGENFRNYAFSTNTLKNAIATFPDSRFILHSGDLVNDGSNENQWTYMLDQAAPIYANTTLVPAAGNHDSNQNVFSDHFNLYVAPNSSVDSGVYYSFDYGNAHVITLNTNEVSKSCPSLSKEQLDWLKKDVSTARQNGIHWIIVNLHKGIYTIGSHATDKDITNLRTTLAPLFENLGVDLVIQGHDHCPSCTKPLANGKIVKNGVVYLETGEAGVKTYKSNTTISKEYLSLFQYIAPSNRARGTYANFAGITVTANTLTIKMYEINTKKGNKSPYLLHEIAIEK